MVYKYTKYLLVSAIIFTAAAASAQSAFISGRVYDKQTHEPIAFASVLSLETKQGAVTDVNGYFKINHSSPEKIHLIAAFVGYKTDTVLATAGKLVSIYLQRNTERSGSIGHAHRNIQNGIACAGGSVASRIL